LEGVVFVIMGVEYATEVRLRSRFGAGHIPMSAKNGGREESEKKSKNGEGKLRQMDQPRRGRYENSTRPADKKRATRHLPCNPIVSYRIISCRTLYCVHYAPIAGLKLVISSYNSSFNCSRLISSLCTAPKINTNRK
jgi:hypothetical protein